jgi:hypothetical protein
MRTLLISSALAVSTILFAVPVSAHHNSPYSEELEGQIPEDALDRHNDMVGEVLDRMEELGVAGQMGGSTVSNDMDPADSAQGDTCAIWTEDGCDTESSNPEGMDRGPEVTPPDELPSGL